MGYKTYVKMKKIFWFSILITIFVSCYKHPTIEPGDIVKKCVIDTMYITESPSTIEFGKRYNYKTDCDELIMTRRSDVYEIGDTITYVYKRR